MKKFPFLALAVTILALGAIVGCGTLGSGSGSSTGPGNTGSTWSGTWDTSYSISSRLVGTTGIATTHATSIYKYCGSLNGAPVLNYDTSLAGADTTSYRVQGNKLMIEVADTNTLLGGTKVVYWSVYTRSSGSGVTGTWTTTFAESLEVVGASYPSDSVQKLRDQQNQSASAAAQAGMSEQVTISTSNIHIQIHYGNYAKYEAAMFSNFYLSGGYYSITIQATSPTTIVYTGNVTHEVVTETFLSRTATRYSSTDSTHAPYTTYSSLSDASQCTADDWFTAFEIANHEAISAGRALPHATQGHVRRKLSGSFGFPILP